MQCNLTKLNDTEYDRRCYFLISVIFTNFCRLLCKKCDIGCYLIHHRVMKLMITG